MQNFNFFAHFFGKFIIYVSMYLIVIYVILTGLNSAYFLRVYIKHEAYVIFCNLKKNEIGARLPQPGAQFHIRPPDGAAIQKQFFFFK